MRRVLIVEPDAALRGGLLRAVRAAGYAAEEASDASVAAERARSLPLDAAVVDVAKEEGLACVEMLRGSLPRLAIVATGADPSVERAVQAMKRGAAEFVRKPFAVGALEGVLASALEPGEAEESGSLGGLLTEDPGMERVLRLCRSAAATEASIQIVGESGTGKDLLARAIHRQSPRRGGPFVVVNCAALPETLAESELFGHERGSFTGATDARPGQVASADGGTLLLDEVSETSPSLQPKLLRMLQEREVLAVGALAPRPVDVRIVSTTQRDLAGEVAAGRFREDLFFRLDVIVLHLPPLRERPGDVPLLARAFLERMAERAGVEPPRLDAGGLAKLGRHTFRGNVRELENLMRRAVVLFPGRVVDVDRLMSRRGPVTPAAGASPADTLNLREIERRTVIRSLEASGGNRTAASRSLGISVRTLRNKIRLYGLA